MRRRVRRKIWERFLRWPPPRSMSARCSILRATKPRPCLECCYKPEGELPRGAKCVAGKQSSEVDDFKRIADVRDVGLEAYRAFFVLVEIDAHRSILREVRIDAAEIKVEVVNHHLAVLRGILLRS